MMIAGDWIQAIIGFVVVYVVGVVLMHVIIAVGGIVVIAMVLKAMGGDK